MNIASFLENMFSQKDRPRGVFCVGSDFPWVTFSDRPPPPYIFKRGCFGTFGARAAHRKKRRPGIRGLHPGIAFCRKLSAKSYWYEKNDWIFTKNWKTTWISKISRNCQNFQKKIWITHHDQDALCRVLFFPKMDPPRRTPPLHLFPAKKCLVPPFQSLASRSSKN